MSTPWPDPLLEAGIRLGSARWPLGEPRRGRDWLVGGNRSKRLTQMRRAFTRSSHPRESWGPGAIATALAALENERELFETSGFAFARALRVSRAEKGLRLGEFG